MMDEGLSNIEVLLAVVMAIRQNLLSSMAAIFQIQNLAILHYTRLKQVNKRQKPHVYDSPRIRSIVEHYLSTDAENFRMTIRIKMETFQVLNQLLESPKLNGWALQYELLVTLYWLACGTPFRILANVFAIPSSTIFSITTRILQSLVALSPRFIVLPSSQQELAVIGENFVQMGESEIFRQCAGVIDSAHVRIVAPKRNSTHRQNLGYRSVYSMHLQGLVDHRGMFIDVLVGFPGDTEDTYRILRNSPLYYQRLYPPDGHYILGDGGYPCIEKPIAILSAYQNPKDVVEVRFNTYHNQARNIGERAFGQLRSRFPAVFNKTLEVKTEKAVSAVYACCILHNICKLSGDEWPEYECRPDDLPALKTIKDERQLTNYRDMLARKLSTVDLLPSVLLDHNYL